MYPAAGWVSHGGEDVGIGMSGEARAGRSTVLTGSGLFSGVSSGSSDEGDEETQQAARGIQQQLSASPLWVLDMFAPQSGESAAVKAAAASAAAKLVAEEPAVPRSLNEIYKLSNLNKRRGGTRKSGEEVPQGAPPGAAASAETAGVSAEAGGGISSESDVGSSDVGEAEEVEDDMEEDDDESESKRRKNGGEADGWTSPSKEDTDDFMRRDRKSVV